MEDIKKLRSDLPIDSRTQLLLKGKNHHFRHPGPEGRLTARPPRPLAGCRLSTKKNWKQHKPRATCGTHTLSQHN